MNGSSATGNGWLCVKKRGRDDHQIELDRRLALEARKEDRRRRLLKKGRQLELELQRLRKNGNNNGRSRKNTNKDDHSLGSFIVDNEDDEADDAAAASEEEEKEEDDDALEEEEEEVFVVEDSIRPSLQGHRRSFSSSTSSSSSSLTETSPKATKTKPRLMPSRSSAAGSPDLAWKRPSAGAGEKENAIEILTSSPSEEEDLDDETLGDRNKESWRSNNNNSSGHNPRKGRNVWETCVKFLDSSSDDDEDDILLLPFDQQGKLKKAAVKAAPTAKAGSTKAAASKAPSWRNDDDGDDDDARPESSERNAEWDWRRNFDEADFADDDEAVALRHAIEESLLCDTDEAEDAAPRHRPRRKNAKKREKKRIGKDSSVENDGGGCSKKPSAAASNRRSPEILTVDDFNVDGSDNKVPVGNDEDAGERAAASVLETANCLSAQVLAAMARWSSAGSSDGNDSAKDSGNDAGGGDDGNAFRSSTAPGAEGGIGDAGAVMGGLIVDGALAIGHLRADESLLVRTSSSSSSSSGWISSELLRTLCPSVKLAVYQLVGVNWLALLHGLKCAVDLGKGTKEHSVNGVLADEMGLGKTVQTIVFLRYLKHLSDQNSAMSPRLPHLVVVPASVLSNWERELQTFAPDLSVVKFHGTMQEREDLRDEITARLRAQDQIAGRSQEIDVILAPVSYFQKEKATERQFLKRFEYDYLVVDEAHVLKNANGTRFKSLNRLRSQHRLLLTGTPVQNSPLELLTLLCFLMPNFLTQATADPEDYLESDGGPSAMLRHFVTIEGRRLGLREGVASATDDAATAYRKLKQLFAPFVLRRKKVDVLHQLLPPKRRHVEYVDLEPSGLAVYNSLLEEHVRQRETGGQTTKTATSGGQHLFTQLRKASHHPLLLRTRYRSASERAHLARCFHQYGAFQGEACTVERVYDELETMNDFNIHLTALELLGENPVRGAEDLQRYVLSESDLFASAKFERLRTLLPSLLEAGHRVLIFSVWTSCLDLLGCLMEALGLAYLRMDGTTPVSERQALMDEFNSSPDSIPVFLLSTKACGLGINLTSADVCIVHDIDFNPFNDLQAEDRCHRIGQTKEVTVYKLVSRNTVDEDIYRMQERKSQMNAAILESDPAGGPPSSLSDFDAARERENVLKDAVERYLCSPRKAPPPPPCYEEKENSSAVL